MVGWPSWLERYEFTFVGRSPIQFRNIRMIPPVASHQMADLFCQHDIYITASRNDPCSNSLIEALSCGIPAIFLHSGGHPEIVKDAGFGFHEAYEIPALLEHLVGEYELRQGKITVPVLHDVCAMYLKILELS